MRFQELPEVIQAYHKNHVPSLLSVRARDNDTGTTFTVVVAGKIAVSRTIYTWRYEEPNNERRDVVLTGSGKYRWCASIRREWKK